MCQTVLLNSEAVNGISSNFLICQGINVPLPIDAKWYAVTCNCPSVAMHQLCVGNAALGMANWLWKPVMVTVSHSNEICLSVAILFFCKVLIKIYHNYFALSGWDNLWIPKENSHLCVFEKEKQVFFFFFFSCTNLLFLTLCPEGFNTFHTLLLLWTLFHVLAHQTYCDFYCRGVQNMFFSSLKLIIKY